VSVAFFLLARSVARARARAPKKSTLFFFTSLDRPIETVRRCRRAGSLLFPLSFSFDLLF